MKVNEQSFTVPQYDTRFIDTASLPPCQYMRPMHEDEQTMTIHWNELSVGGHFAAFMQPELFY